MAHEERGRKRSGGGIGVTLASRRNVLRGFAMATLAGTAGTVGAGAALAGRKDFWVVPRPNKAPDRPAVVVYRLRARKTRACRACRRHHRYIVFRSRLLADSNRAHPGCDCPIVVQAIKKQVFRRLFPPGSDGIASLPRGLTEPPIIEPSPTPTIEASPTPGLEPTWPPWDEPTPPIWDDLATRRSTGGLKKGRVS